VLTAVVGVLFSLGASALLGLAADQTSILRTGLLLGALLLLSAAAAVLFASRSSLGALVTGLTALTAQSMVFLAPIHAASLTEPWLQRLVSTGFMLTLAGLWLGIGLAAPTLALLILAIPPLLSATYSGIASTPRATVDAARAMGLGYGTAMKEIVFPQAIKNILPALANEFISLFKETSVVGLVAITDLTFFSKSMQAALYTVQPILFAAVLYYASVKFFSLLVKMLERRLNRND